MIKNIVFDYLNTQMDDLKEKFVFINSNFPHQ